MHLLDAEGGIVAWDTPRYELPVDLEPGDTVTFLVLVEGLARPGRAAAFDLVREGVFWWSGMAGAGWPAYVHR